MAIELIDELMLVDVFDHGKPNLERIAIYVQKACDLSHFCLYLGMPGPEMPFTPVRDHMLWFGSGQVNAGDWIFVYTASGTTTITPNGLPKPGAVQQRIINIHWGKEHTVFQNRAVSPLLIRIGGIGVLAPPPPAYQGKPDTVQPRIY